MLVPNRSVRSELKRQRSGVDFAYRGTRPRPGADSREGRRLGGPIFAIVIATINWATDQGVT